jgi:hypothetical protein
VLISVCLIALLFVCAALVGFVAKFLGRPLPRPVLLAFLVVAVLPFPRAFVTELTILPLDQAMNFRPWYVAGRPAGYNPHLNDVATQILPWAKATRLAWKEGNPPLRFRWNGCGLPLAANGVSAAFSPLTFIALLLPLAKSYALVGSLKLLLAAAGMWLWTRELGATSRSALFAAAAFTLSLSFAPPWLLFPQTAVICLWPWLLFLLERARDEEGRRRTIATLTAIFVCTELAGHPEDAVLGFLFAALWIFTRWLSRDLQPIRPVLRALSVSAALALGLTAFLLIPSIFAIAASERIATMKEPYWQQILSLAPHGPSWLELPGSFFPHSMGNGIASPRLPVSGPGFAENALGYFGIVALAQILLILRPGSRRPRAEWVLLGIAVAGLGIAVGQWPFAEIISRAPLLRFVLPHRFHSWQVLAGGALAALELDRLVRDWQGSWRVTAWAVAAPVLLATAAVAVHRTLRPHHALAGGAEFQDRELLVVLAVLALAAALAIFVRRRPAAYVWGLTLLVCSELLYQWNGLFRLNTPIELFPETPAIAFLRTQPGVFRVLGEGPVMFPSTNVFAGLEDIRTHDATERRDYLGFLDATAGYPSGEYFKKVGNLNAPALDFLNVRYLLTDPGRESPGEKWTSVYAGPDLTIFENRRALPRVAAPARIRLVKAATGGAEASLDARIAFGPAFRELTQLEDWRETAFVLSDRNSEGGNPTTEVRDYTESTNRASFVARVAPGGGEAVVVASLVQDGGWSARDESGNRLRTLRANGPFLAIVLPEGERRVRLEYRPPGFLPGVGVSIATICLLLALGLRRRLQQRESG